MKNYILIFILTSILLSCNKEKDALSTVKKIHHPEILINNASVVILKAGDALPTDTPFVMIDTVYGFIDQNGRKVDTLYVDDTYMTKIPTQIPGAYGLTYVVYNTAGYPVAAPSDLSRTLFIYDDIADANSNDISGTYTNIIPSGGGLELTTLTPGVYLMDNATGYNAVLGPYFPSLLIYRSSGLLTVLGFKAYGVTFTATGGNYNQLGVSPSSGDILSYSTTTIISGSEYLYNQQWVRD